MTRLNQDRRKFLKAAGSALFLPVFDIFVPVFGAENVKSVGPVAKANIKSVGSVSEANIKAIGPVDNTGGGGCSNPITTADDYWSGASEGSEPVGDSANKKYVATYFKAGSAYDPCLVKAWLHKVGSPTADMVMHIYNQASDLPNVSIGSSDAVNMATVGGTETEISFPNLNVAGNLTPDAFYYRVIVCSTTAAANYVRWHFVTGTYPFFAMTVGSPDGTTWTQISNVAGKSQNLTA